MPMRLNPSHLQVTYGFAWQRFKRIKASSPDAEECPIIANSCTWIPSGHVTKVTPVTLERTHKMVAPSGRLMLLA